MQRFNRNRASARENPSASWRPAEILAEEKGAARRPLSWGSDSRPCSAPARFDRRPTRSPPSCLPGSLVRRFYSPARGQPPADTAPHQPISFRAVEASETLLRGLIRPVKSGSLAVENPVANQEAAPGGTIEISDGSAF